MSVEALKAEIVKQWNATPCGSDAALNRLDTKSLAFFDAVRTNRYEVCDRWMKQVIGFHRADGKRLLEVGYGMGTDLLTWAENGAEVHGVDLTPEHYRQARENFRWHDRYADLRLCDAASLPFPDGYFDFVYSHGVLHHTPDIGACLAEIYRVLRPGGTLILSLYHKWSAFHLYTKLFYEGLLRGRLFSLGYRGLMATVERGADGIAVCPQVKTYSRRQVKKLLRPYRELDFKVAGLTRDVLPRIGRLTPRRLLRMLEPRLGWYVVAFAKK